MGSQVARRLKGRAARGWRCLSAVALALCMTQAFAINLKVGELKIMNPGDIDRVAVGNANVISTSLLKNGQLLVFGEAPGLTTLHLWLKNGQESQVEFTVDKSDYSAAVNSGVLQQKLAAVKKLVMDIPGLEAAVVGDKIVLSGQYDGRYAPQVAAVKAAYPEALDLSISTKLAEVKQLVADIKGIDVRLVGSRIVLSGTIDDGYEATINTIMGAYPDVMDLTRKEEVELPDDKMVLVNIKITEFNKSASDSLGINWSNNFAGPGRRHSLGNHLRRLPRPGRLGDRRQQCARTAGVGRSRRRHLVRLFRHRDRNHLAYQSRHQHRQRHDSCRAAPGGAQRR
jgi:Flp pilus assembly secretin CpaC